MNGLSPNQLEGTAAKSRLKIIHIDGVWTEGGLFYVPGIDGRVTDYTDQDDHWR